MRGLAAKARIGVLQFSLLSMEVEILQHLRLAGIGRPLRDNSTGIPDRRPGLVTTQAVGDTRYPLGLQEIAKAIRLSERAR